MKGLALETKEALGPQYFSYSHLLPSLISIQQINSFCYQLIFLSYFDLDIRFLNNNVNYTMTIKEVKFLHRM